ncbi:sensor domain-containing diguanylate cyclase [Pseudomonas sp. BMS12]|uniref:sensor domain-containing diguanylate cyclase n=1 Tax=Pseudomonas sp. BMS12 TaxID=1796033 RepID=UPI000AEC78D2|nr:sensor domain-containing diguanylate cyclase [Pseudomonas sp. BMS12]
MGNSAEMDVKVRRWWQRPTVLPLARTFVVLVCLSLVLTDGWLIWKARQIQLHAAAADTSNLAQALARQTADMLKKADIVLADLIERLQVDGTGPEQMQRLQTLMRRQVLEQPELHGLFVYGTDGSWLVSSFGQPPREINSSDREYFTHHTAPPFSNDLYIGAPIRSRTTGDWIIPLSRRVEDAQGRFLGVALATLSVEFLRGFYATFDIDTNGLIDLVHNDGTVLLRTPYSESALGSSVAKGEIFSRLLESHPVGTAMLPSVTDGVQRLFSYRPVNGYPLVVVTGMAKDDILAGWLADSVRQLVVVGFMAGLLGLFGFYLLSLIKQGQKTQVELLATRDALRAFNQRLETQALEDELTCLANRRRLMRALDDEFARASRYQRPLALILFDVDYFKQYNDIYGHSAGDECLRAVAEVIRGGQKRPADLAARYGGEEFCLLLPETDGAGALRVAEQIRAALEAQALPHAGAPWLRLSLSAGVNVCLPQPGAIHDAGPSALIQGADQALYAAKAAGRDRVMLFAEAFERAPG